MIVEEIEVMTRRRQFEYYGIYFCCVFITATVSFASEDAVADLGTTTGMPQMSGFVFIDGRYLRPPYTVSRKGDSIFINRQFVEQPTSWNKKLNAVLPSSQQRSAVSGKGLGSISSIPQDTLTSL